MRCGSHLLARGCSPGRQPRARWTQSISLLPLPVSSVKQYHLGPVKLFEIGKPAARNVRCKLDSEDGATTASLVNIHANACGAKRLRGREYSPARHRRAHINSKEQAAFAAHQSGGSSTADRRVRIFLFRVKPRFCSAKERGGSPPPSWPILRLGVVVVGRHGRAWPPFPPWSATRPAAAWTSSMRWLGYGRTIRHGRIPAADEAGEGPDGRKPLIAGPGGASAIFLEMREELQHMLGCDIAHGQPVYGFAQLAG